MSCLLPASLTSVLRHSQSVMLDMYGVDCTLYVANNSTALQTMDAYVTTDDRTFTTVTTKVFIVWKESQFNLRKLGLYTEDGLPITAQFKYSQIIPIGSYFTITINYPAAQDDNGEDTADSTDTDEFEIVNSSTNGMLDTLVFPTYSIAPRRKQ